MLAQPSYPSNPQSEQNAKAEAIGQQLRLVANDLYTAREEEAKQALETIAKSRAEVIREAREILLDNVVKAAKILAGFLDLKKLTPGEYRAARIKMDALTYILRIHGFNI